MALTSCAARVLLTLRAGPITPAQYKERHGNWPHKVVDSLVYAGMVRLIPGRRGGDYEPGRYELTDRGQAECPVRNPASRQRTAPVSAHGSGTGHRWKRSHVVGPEAGHAR